MAFRLQYIFFSGWLSAKFPGIDFFAHNSGHLFEDFFGWGGDPHFGPFHIASYILIIYGFMLLSKAWKALYKAQSEHTFMITALHSYPSSAIHWLYTNYAWLSSSVANASNAHHVSHSCFYVYTTCQERRERCSKRIWGDVGRICQKKKLRLSFPKYLKK